MHVDAHTHISVFLGILLATGTVSAQEDDEDGSIIDLSPLTDTIDDLIEAFDEFTGDWDQTLTEVLLDVLFHPFRSLAEVLLNVVAKLLTTTPTVNPNPAVEEIHSQVLILVILLSSLAFMAAGLLYMIGPVLGITYSQVRLILPRILIALVFSFISLPVLQLTVDLTDALVYAFTPQLFEQSFSQLIGLSTGLVLAWVIQSLLLVAVAALMIIRMVYIMFVAAISPLLALTWSLPRIRRYADTFIAGYFAALMIAPLNLLVLQFCLALLDGNGTTVIQSTSNWILGVASLTLLLLVPYQVWTASQTIVGKATKTASKTVNKNQNNQTQNFDLSEDEQNRLQSYRRRKQAEKLGGGK
ncbi:hypothetical protein [Halorubrum vacuolatum]|uniref:TrbL/VirB6 plasmid conjugal transfer protein n=1 Tax=Halorubrum vacuolatum TaxID=63740 RepID=A0A238YG87_HALVU|nr:hypothetical protein [Halorubrum vacuolatum]SNR69379.1 hypothetical protein SAMN06264855_14011 [Halorubrum vacuolatum]